MTEQDVAFLRRAFELAANARSAGDEPFGSLLVADATVLAEAQNTVVSDSDIAAHPELKLARWAARELTRERLHRTTMYTSCQPCPMCQEAIQRSGLARVMFGLSAAQLTDMAVDDIGPAGAVATEGPFLFEEARRPLDGYRAKSRPGIVER